MSASSATSAELREVSHVITAVYGLLSKGRLPTLREWNEFLAVYPPARLLAAAEQLLTWAIKMEARESENG